MTDLTLSQDLTWEAVISSSLQVQRSQVHLLQCIKDH